MRRTDPPAKDVEHAGDILDRGRWVQFVRRKIGHGKEKPAVRNQFLQDLWMRQTCLCLRPRIM